MGNSNCATHAAVRWTLVLTVAGVTGFGLAGSAQAGEPKTAKSDVQAVEVTPEMIGAGIVSSGVTLPPIPPVTGTREKPVDSWETPLPYPIVIADRRNNRLIEIAPDKRIVWEFPSPNLKIYRGNDDVFFSPDGKQLVVNEDDNYDLHIVDYNTRKLTWTFGASDVKGSKPGYFNYPDDAHLMADGKVIVADIRNCRVQFIDPATSTVVGQWGKEQTCKHDPPRFLASNQLRMSACLSPRGLSTKSASVCSSSES